MVYTTALDAPLPVRIPAHSQPTTLSTTICTFEVELATMDSSAPLAEAAARLQTLCERFTRFSPDSELSRFNAVAGTWMDVSRDMHLLLSTALTAAVESRGLVNIAVLNRLLAAGYSQSWSTGQPFGKPTERNPQTEPVPALTEVLELQDNRARLMPGIALDFGGIAKGVWADMIVELLGTNSRCSLGGDIACRGAGPFGDGWPVSVPNGDIVWVTDGGIATSGTLKRQWGNAHHLIDPRTGRPCQSDISMLTAIATNCQNAEWVAKSCVIGGSATTAELHNHPSVSALFAAS